MFETVNIKTQDGVAIVGDYYPADGWRGVLLLHMMPRDRKSWTALARELKQNGFQALAIDLRGHGESQGGPQGYKKFSDYEHQGSRLDVKAGVDFLKEKGVAETHLIGASIGANLALKYLAENPDSKSAILLSPGLDYRGIKIEPLISQVRTEQALFLAAADDDVYSRDTVKVLAGKVKLDEKHCLKVFPRGGHGTELLEAHPKFGEELVRWLKSIKNLLK